MRSGHKEDDFLFCFLVLFGLVYSESKHFDIISEISITQNTPLKFNYITFVSLIALSKII